MPNKELLVAALTSPDRPKEFVPGKLYDRATGCYCLMGWLGHKAGVPNAELSTGMMKAEEGWIETMEWIAKHYDIPVESWKINDWQKDKPYVKHVGMVDSAVVVKEFLDLVESDKLIDAVSLSY